MLPIRNVNRESSRVAFPVAAGSAEFGVGERGKRYLDSAAVGPRFAIADVNASQSVNSVR
jgi:hypothetical protein